MQNLNDWNVEGAFARNYTMFGLLVVVLFCLLWLVDIYDIAFIIFGLLIYFFSNDYMFTHKIGKILSDPDSEVSFKASTNFLLALSYILCSIGSLLVYSDYFHLTIQSFDQLSLVVTYLKSLLITLAIFDIYLAFKLTAIGFHIISYLQVKRGIFAIFHRFSVFLRSFFVTKLWLNFFSNSTDAKLIPIIISKDFSICKMYLIAKSIFFAQLIWDFDIVRNTFYVTYHKLFALNQCVNVNNCEICQKPSKQQIELVCGHKFCLKCIENELKNRPFCPVCDKPPMNDPKIAFFDGSVSLSSIFCCF